MIVLTKVDRLVALEHSHLRDEDECYYLREYTRGKGYKYSDTNNLISNFKKSPDQRGKPSWKYKARASSQIVSELRAALDPDFLASTLLVPMPPSKAPSDPLYDARMLKVLQDLGDYDVRDLLRQRTSVEAAHLAETRPDIDEILANLELDEALALPAPTSIAVFDDVLTTGKHFRAAKRILQDRFTDVPIVGVFVSRRVFPPDDGDDGDDE